MALSRLLARYGLAILVIAAAIAAIHLLTQPRGVHLTEAWFATEDTLGYQAPPAAIEPADLGLGWARVNLPYAGIPALTQTRLQGTAEAPTQISWYRVVLPQPVLASDAEYLFIPRWKSDGEIAVYVNGRIQYQSHANLQWNGSNKALRLAFDNTAGAEPISELVIRMQHLRGIGGALSSLWVGGFEELGLTYMVRTFFQADLPQIASAVFLASGLFAFFVWLGRRRETLYLLFFLMSLANFLRTMHTYMGTDRLPLPDSWFGWLTVNSLLWMIAIAHLFLAAIHQRPVRAVTWIVAVTTVVTALLTFPLFEWALDPTLTSPFAYAAMFVLANLVGIVGLLASLRAGSMEATALAAWVMTTAYLGIYDLLLQRNLVDIESYFLVPYVQIAIVIAFFHVVVGRYAGAVSEVERSNLVLAERLAAREAELVANHERLRESEQRELLHHERQRLMEDMHDGLGSSLVSALRMVERGRLDETAMTQVLQGCIDDLKLTIDSMEPVETDLLLLLGTLRFRLQPRLESTGIRLRWEVKDVPPLDWLDHRHSLHILRILQEAFTNIFKHTSATEVVVSTDVSAAGIVVGISDNGSGFDAADRRPGRGLSNQARRAEAIGGRIDIKSGAHGTRLELTLPIRQHNRQSVLPETVA